MFACLLASNTCLRMLHVSFHGSILHLFWGLNNIPLSLQTSSPIYLQDGIAFKLGQLVPKPLQTSKRAGWAFCRNHFLPFKLARMGLMGCLARVHSVLCTCVYDTCVSTGKHACGGQRAGLESCFLFSPS